ncbi:hypothetical protein [uncultured Helicobacter sp.]|uniref:hypothetical protein n=1 Tax=uncultured Helicobacter sp. TaxID=175537 RepID=UPI0026133D61|nr:hypothetical protein [uncultured Helicobacter sp.]
MPILNLSNKDIVVGELVIPAGTMIEGELAPEHRSKYLAVNDKDIAHVMKCKEFLKISMFFASEATLEARITSAHERITIAKERIALNGISEQLTPTEVKQLKADITKQASRMKPLFKRLDKEREALQPNHLEVMEQMASGLELDKHNFIITDICRKAVNSIRKEKRKALPPKIIEIAEIYGNA